AYCLYIHSFYHRSIRLRHFLRKLSFPEHNLQKLQFVFKFYCACAQTKPLLLCAPCQTAKNGRGHLP
ncbi:hypothetical protein, partial [Klebsiella pneumoniae]|uniref:hypothetical protein n=1 Tax=Klebsiella pneumoniae TaxID=573 RepID=UPI001D12AA39